MPKPSLAFLSRILGPLRILAISSIALVANPAAVAENTLDILILYTQEVENYHGGEDGVQAYVQGNIASANQGFENSAVDIRLRLRHLEKTDYSENEDDMNVDLDHITESPTIASLRNQVGADLVCLYRLTSTNDAAGVAWLLENPNGLSNRGFSVVSAYAAGSGFVFQHEIGHNLGGAHDRNNSESGGLYSYSYGYRFTSTYNTQYRTIMAYAPGDRINYFSNPNIKYLDTPTGIASGINSADNTRTFNNIASKVNAYRSHIHLPPIANAGPDLETEDLDENGTESITLDGTASETEWGEASWAWTWIGGNASGETVNQEFPVGSTEVTLTVTDAEGASGQDTVIITITERFPIAYIETGGDTSLFLKENGALWGVGQARDGQLGANLLKTHTSPVLIFPKGVRSVSEGYGHTLVVKEDGSLWAMGSNSAGQLGIEDHGNHFTPVQIMDSDVERVSAGDHHSLILKTGGSVWAMGSNYSGQLGDGTTVEKRNPVRIFPSGITAIAAGSSHSLFLKADGSLWAAGKGFGENPYEATTTPTQIMTIGVVSISASSHSLIIKSDGSLWAFGQNREGQLGIGTTDPLYLPTKIVSSGVIAATAGRDFTLFVKSDGSVWHAGKYVSGLTPDGNSLSPRFLFGNDATSVSAGGNHGLVLREDGSAWAFGNNSKGQLGTGNTDPTSLMVQVFPETRDRSNNAPNADAGSDISIPDSNGDGLATIPLNGSNSTDDWQVVSYTWSWSGGIASGKEVLIELPVGANEVTLTVADDDGALDTDTVSITVNPQTNIIAFTAAGGNSFILKEDGSLWGTGFNWGGPLGLGKIESVSEFTLIMESGVTTVSSSGMHTLFVKDDGSLWGMGDNSHGTLGSQDQYVFEPVKLRDSDVVAVEANSLSSFYMLSDGSVWAMGYNSYGKLGNGDSETQRTPVRIFESGIKRISTGVHHTLFTKSNGSLWAAGNHGFGEFNPNIKSPIELAPSNVLDAVAGNTYSLILYVDGSVQALGRLEGFHEYQDDRAPFEIIGSGATAIDARNENYQILMEDGSLLGKRLEEILSSGVAAFSAGSSHSLFLRTDGSLWGSGYNNDGALGLGESESEEVPFATLIFETDDPIIDSPPIAYAGPDIQIAEANGDGRQIAILDASESSDDWQVVSWHWDWEGGSSDEAFAFGDFEEGITEVTLTVSDAFGKTSQDTLAVNILPQAKIEAVAGGNRHGLMLMDNGSVFAIGSSHLESAIWPETVNDQAPILTIDSEGAKVAAGNGSSLILKNDGSLWSFGSNARGQLGNGSYKDQPTPTMVIPNGVIDISAGGEHCLILKEDGSVWAFGLNSNGQLATGSTDDSATPVLVIPSGVTAISAGNTHSLFLKEDGSLWGSGDGWDNVLGYDIESNQLTPLKIFDDGVAAMAAGRGQTLVLMENGNLFALNGQSDSPIKVPDFPSPIRAINAKDDSSFFLLEDGSAWGVESPIGVDRSRRLHMPQKLFGSDVIGLSGSLFLKSDKSVWKKGNLENPATEIVKSINPSTNKPPIANAGPDIVAYDTEKKGYAYIALDASLSTDDWQIISWSWSWTSSSDNANLNRDEDQARSHHPFTVGESIVTLTVFDDQGLSSTDEIRVNILEGDDFIIWLKQFFNENQINYMEPDPRTADFDNDGYTNEEEQQMGLNPSVAIDPFTQSESKLMVADGKLYLEVTPYANGLAYTLWGTSDFVNWSTLDYPTHEFNGSLRIELPRDLSKFYKLQISGQ